MHETDPVSVFGRVILLERTYTGTDEGVDANTTREIQSELESAFREAAMDDRINVTVIELRNSTSGNFLAHVELIVSDQQNPPNLTRLALNQSVYDSDLRFEGE